jgi:acyl-CoA synthetase (AMP-forming)/AMP-acid ligase II
VLEPGAHATEAELREFCAANLALYEIPKDFGFADELERTMSGKLVRARF